MGLILIRIYLEGNMSTSITAPVAPTEEPELSQQIFEIIGSSLAFTYAELVPAELTED